MKKLFAFTLAEVFHPLRRSKRIAFTLAEVLITLGIIGVVAALTLPSLIANYRKHVYYTQFRKAATVIDSAINSYNHDYGCGTEVDYGTEGGTEYVNNLCQEDNSGNYADKLSKYINVAQWITEDNYEEVCKGYKKLPPANNYDGSDRRYEGNDICSYWDIGGTPINGYGFITPDGMMFNFAADEGAGSSSIVDTNGPDKGPNIFGRDIFAFYIWQIYPNRWGYPKEHELATCYDNSNKLGSDCGIRLLQEGKMNY